MGGLTGLRGYQPLERLFQPVYAIYQPLRSVERRVQTKKEALLMGELLIKLIYLRIRILLSHLGHGLLLLLV
jgi:hypothetical protein